MCSLLVIELAMAPFLAMALFAMRGTRCYLYLWLPLAFNLSVWALLGLVGSVRLWLMAFSLHSPESGFIPYQAFFASGGALCVGVPAVLVAFALPKRDKWKISAWIGPAIIAIAIGAASMWWFGNLLIRHVFIK